MELDYKNISSELQQLKDLQAEVIQRLAALQSCLSSAVLNADNGAVSSVASAVDASSVQSMLDEEQKALDQLWEDKVYDAVCPDASKPLTEDELKSFGFGISAEDYTKYMDSIAQQETQE